MKFMYLGEGSTTVFGHTFKAGEPVEVADEHAFRKLRSNHLFTHDEETAAPKVDEAPKRRGRPPNAQN